MKDKRQRIAVTWPYAAICNDPTFAASLLQAAANTVNMPYFAPHPMIPQMPVMPPPNSPPASSHYAYRYSPYQIPPRTTLEMPQATYPPHLTTPLLAPMPADIDYRYNLNNSYYSDYSSHSSSSHSSSSPQSLSPVWSSEKLTFPHDKIDSINEAQRLKEQHCDIVRDDINNNVETILPKTVKHKLFQPYITVE